MSAHLIRWIPLDPSFVPSDLATRRATDWLKARTSSEVEATTTDEIAFVDCGGNFEAVSCNRCGSDLDQEWWTEAMDGASQSKFQKRDVVLPCCGVTEDLNLLRYDFPMGFARFVLEVRDAGIGTPREEDDAEVERILGTRVRRIHARY